MVRPSRAGAPGESRAAEHDRNYWKREAGRLKEALVVSNAALSEKQDRISFMERGSAHFYREVATLREKLKRWDTRNWTELCIAVLKGGEIRGMFTWNVRFGGPATRRHGSMSANRRGLLHEEGPCPCSSPLPFSSSCSRRAIAGPPVPTLSGSTSTTQP